MATAKKQDAIELLTADHRKVEGLFAKFEKATNDDDKATLAKQICVELVVHATIEEEILYPAATGEAEDDTVNEAYVEHDSAKVLIAEIAEGSPDDDDFFDAKVTVLSEMIKHHVKEEEQPDGLFDQMEEAGLDMDELGAALAARKAALTAQIEKKGLPPLTTRSFSGHDLDAGEPLEGASPKAAKPTQKKAAAE